MKTFNRFGRLAQSSSLPPIRQSSNVPTLDQAVKIEEQKMSAYDRGLYYPVKLGGVFRSRYRAISKLGFGANSTVWLCRDLQQHRYIALKIFICSSKTNQEVRVLEHLSSTKTDHPGRSLVSQMIDNFDIIGPTGNHHCIVHEPLLTSLVHFQATFDPPSLPEDILKGALQELLRALDYLHTEANVIHTDIQAKNIIIGSREDSIFREWD